MRKFVILILFTAVLIGGMFFFMKRNEISPKTELTKDEISLVDSYLRNNIKTIATNDPVLGGSWYVISTEINPTLNSGSIIYEDGHIQSMASFEYELEDTTNNITIKNFEVKP